MPWDKRWLDAVPKTDFILSMLKKIPRILKVRPRSFRFVL